MSEAFIDRGSIPFPGFINAAPTFNPLFLIENPAPAGIGIYVSAVGGSDANPGTLAEPLATLNAALIFRSVRPNTEFVTIFLLPGNYTQGGNYTISNNTALVGVQAGALTDYINATEQSLGGSSVTLTNYVLALGSLAPATGARVLLSGLNILGQISPQYSQPTHYIYNCNVQNNTGIGFFAGIALYANVATRVFVDSCSFATNQIANAAVFSQSEELSLVNSTVRMTNVNPGVGAASPIDHDYGATALGVQYLTIRNCEIGSANGFASRFTPLIKFPTAGGAPQTTVVEIVNSTLRYDQTTTATTSTDKVCIRVQPGRVINMTVANCLLLQPGGGGDSILSTGTTTLTYGNNLGINGRNGKSVQTSTPLQTMP